MISVAALSILVLVGLIAVAIFNRPLRDRMLGWYREVNGWHLAFVAVLAVLAASLVFPLRGMAVLIGLAAVAALFALTWVHEFTLLMRQNDEMFPGRYDKPVWALLLIALPPVGVLAFWSFRRAHWPEPKSSHYGAVHDLV
jgi:hypothetical protein